MINLLLYKAHFCFIKDFDRRVNSQLTKHNGKRYHRYRCLNIFTTENGLKDHHYYCKNHEARRVIVDNEDVNFKNYNHSMRVPFAIYADSEAFLKPISTCANILTRTIHCNARSMCQAHMLSLLRKLMVLWINK